MKRNMKNILLGSLALLAMNPINQSLDNNLISVENNNIVKEKSTVSPLDLTIEDLKYYSEYSTGTSDLYQGLWQNYEETPTVLAGESYLFNIQDFYDGGYGGITGDSTLLFSVDNTTFNLENDILTSVDKHSYLVTSVALKRALTSDGLLEFIFSDDVDPDCGTQLEIYVFNGDNLPYKLPVDTSDLTENVLVSGTYSANFDTRYTKSYNSTSLGKGLAFTSDFKYLIKSQEIKYLYFEFDIEENHVKPAITSRALRTSSNYFNNDFELVDNYTNKTYDGVYSEEANFYSIYISASSVSNTYTNFYLTFGSEYDIPYGAIKSWKFSVFYDTSEVQVPSNTKFNDPYISYKEVSVNLNSTYGDLITKVSSDVDSYFGSNAKKIQPYLEDTLDIDYVFDERIVSSYIPVYVIDQSNVQYYALVLYSVVDNIAPTISLKSGYDLEFEIGESISSTNLKTYFEVTDNYDDNPEITSFKLDNSALTSKTFKSSDFGNHTLSVTARDSSNNIKTSTFTLKVIDTNSPKITRSDGGSGNIKIGLSKVLNLTEKEFCQLFEATDDVDGDVSDTLAINGDFIDNHVGNYTVKLQAHDDSGNFGSLTVEVEVLSDVPPVFILGDALVLASTDNPLSSDQIEKVIINGLASDYDITTLYYDAESYLATPTEVGDYIVTYSYDYLNEEGVEESSTGNSFTLRVQGDQVEDNKEEESNWWADFCRWWIDGFQCLWNWLCGRGWYTNAELGLE